MAQLWIVSPLEVMRISEFNRAASAYQKQSIIACIVPLSIALLFICAYALFQKRFESFLSTMWDGSIVDVLTVLPIALPTVMAFAFMIPLARRIDRRAGVACPHCSKALANFKAIVIASKNCPHCGKRVIDDET